jgi:hypothetical protein
LEIDTFPYSTENIDNCYGFQGSYAKMIFFQSILGHVKAWVGGFNYKHFQYDQVKQGRRRQGKGYRPHFIESSVLHRYKGTILTNSSFSHAIHRQMNAIDIFFDSSFKFSIRAAMS